jgi:hypothetical protein
VNHLNLLLHQTGFFDSGHYLRRAASSSFLSGQPKKEEGRVKKNSSLLVHHGLRGGKSLL